MQKKSRLIIVAIPVMVVLAAITAYQYGYQGIKQDKASVKAMQDTNEKMLEKYMALIAETPELEKTLTGLKEKRTADDTKVMEAQTLSIAAASLQETVKTMVTGRGGSITSERVEKPDDLGKMKVINVSIDAVLPDTRALSDLIFGIETHTPYLVIKEIDTRVRNFREPKELMVKLRVSALTGGQ